MRTFNLEQFEEIQRQYKTRNILHNMAIFANAFQAMEYIDDKSIDLICTDLPYKKSSNLDWDGAVPLELMWKHYERIIKPNGAIVLTGDQPFTSKLIMSNLDLFKYTIVYQKTTPTGHYNAKKQPLRSHEDLIVFYKHQPTYNPQKTTGHPRKTVSAAAKRKCVISANEKESVYGKGLPDKVEGYDSTERYPTSVWTFSTDKQKACLHPTQKPLELIETIIKTYSNEGDLILDSHAGSFTTAVACDNLKRKWICIENNENYFEVGKQRVNENLKRLYEIQ